MRPRSPGYLRASHPGSFRIGGMCLLALACMLGTGCSVVSAPYGAVTGPVGFLRDHAAYNDASESLVLGWRNHVWSKKAWYQQRHLFVSHPYVKDFGKGFQAGYNEVANGGSGCVPVLPPREYWSWRYQSPEGQGKTAAWFEGYPVGAAAAEKDGIANWSHIQTGYTADSKSVRGRANYVRIREELLKRELQGEAEDLGAPPGSPTPSPAPVDDLPAPRPRTNPVPAPESLPDAKPTAPNTGLPAPATAPKTSAKPADLTPVELAPAKPKLELLPPIFPDVSQGQIPQPDPSRARTASSDKPVRPDVRSNETRPVIESTPLVRANPLEAKPTEAKPGALVRLPAVEPEASPIQQVHAQQSIQVQPAGANPFEPARDRAGELKAAALKESKETKPSEKGPAVAEADLQPGTAHRRSVALYAAGDVEAAPSLPPSAAMPAKQPTVKMAEIKPTEPKPEAKTDWVRPVLGPTVRTLPPPASPGKEAKAETLAAKPAEPRKEEPKTETRVPRIAAKSSSSLADTTEPASKARAAELDAKPTKPATAAETAVSGPAAPANSAPARETGSSANVATAPLPPMRQLRRAPDAPEAPVPTPLSVGTQVARELEREERAMRGRLGGQVLERRDLPASIERPQPTVPAGEVQMSD